MILFDTNLLIFHAAWMFSLLFILAEIITRVFGLHKTWLAVLFNQETGHIMKTRLSMLVFLLIFSLVGLVIGVLFNLVFDWVPPFWLMAPLAGFVGYRVFPVVVSRINALWVNFNDEARS